MNVFKEKYKSQEKMREHLKNVVMEM